MSKEQDAVWLAENLLGFTEVRLPDNQQQRGLHWRVRMSKIVKTKLISAYGADDWTEAIDDRGQIWRLTAGRTNDGNPCRFWELFVAAPAFVVPDELMELTDE